MSTDTMASNAPASPESAIDDEYLRLQAAKIVADARLEVATEKRKAEKDKAAADVAQVERDKEWQASRAFAQAYCAWLAAKAGLEDPDITDDEQPERWRAQSEAERRLFTTPAASGEQVWDKLTAFEQILGEEMTVGLRKESVLVLAVGSIKQDIINLELHI
jgi:hypothetical protein